MAYRSSILIAAAMIAGLLGAPANARPRWSEMQAAGWYDQQPWRLGSNYVPATAINQLEMWQADTFDPATIDKELGWAQALGMNTMRVFLHNLLWEQDAKGFVKRIDTFLAIAAKHGITLPYASVDDVRRAYAFSDLQSFLDLYYATMDVLRTEDDFAELTRRYLLTAATQGLRHVELFFDPQAHTARGIRISQRRT